MYFAEISAILSELYPSKHLSLGRALDPMQGERLQRSHRKIKQHTFSCLDFNSGDRYHRHLVRDLLAGLFPSAWWARGFLLFDICGFSTRNVAEQVTLRLKLDAAIRRARVHLVGIAGHVPADISAIPTGDGFYLWHRQVGRRFDAFLLALAAMAIADLTKDKDGFGPRVRTALVIDRVYTLPTPDFTDKFPSPEIFRDAIGSALNAGARLCNGAGPDQLLLGDFPSFTEEDPNEPIRSAPDMVKFVNDTYASNMNLVCDPSSSLKVTDKHGQDHRCYNVHGVVHHATLASNTPIKIGLCPDPTDVLHPERFRRP